MNYFNPSVPQIYRISHCYWLITWRIKLGVYVDSLVLVYLLVRIAYPYAWEEGMCWAISQSLRPDGVRLPGDTQAHWWAFTFYKALCSAASTSPVNASKSKLKSIRWMMIWFDNGYEGNWNWNCWLKTEYLYNSGRIVFILWGERMKETSGYLYIKFIFWSYRRRLL